MNYTSAPLLLVRPFPFNNNYTPTKMQNSKLIKRRTTKNESQLISNNNVILPKFSGPTVERFRCIGLPDKLRVRLRYTNLFNTGYNKTTDTTGVVYFLINGLNTTKPRYMNQLLNSTIYQRYRVTRCSVKIAIEEYNAPAPGLILPFKTKNVTYVGTFSAVNSARLPELADFATPIPLGDAGLEEASIEFSVQPWKVLGITEREYMADDKYAAAYNANPSIVGYIGIQITSSQATYDFDVMGNAEVTWDVELYQNLQATAVST